MKTLQTIYTFLTKWSATITAVLTTAFVILVGALIFNLKIEISNLKEDLADERIRTYAYVTSIDSLRIVNTNLEHRTENSKKEDVKLPKNETKKEQKLSNYNYVTLDTIVWDTWTKIFNENAFQIDDNTFIGIHGLDMIGDDIIIKCEIGKPLKGIKVVDWRKKLPVFKYDTGFNTMIFTPVFNGKFNMSSKTVQKNTSDGAFVLFVETTIILSHTITYQ